MAPEPFRVLQADQFLPVYRPLAHLAEVSYAHIGVARLVRASREIPLLLRGHGQGAALAQIRLHLRPAVITSLR